VYICLFAYNSGMGGVIVFKFLGCQWDGFMCKNLRRGHKYRPESWHFSLLAGPTRHLLWQAGWALQWAIDKLGTNTGTGGQCADAIETAVHADRPAHLLHTGLGG